jgi:hypothetical protein
VKKLNKQIIKRKEVEMKALLELFTRLESAVGVCRESKPFRNPDSIGFTIIEPTNFDIGEDILQDAKSLGVQIRIQAEPKHNPENPSSPFPPAIFVKKATKLKPTQMAEMFADNQ